MASSPITSWKIDGETMEKVSDFIFGGSNITADGHCSYEIKRCLLIGSKVMTNLDSLLKSRDVTFPTTVHLVKAMFFSSGCVWMWELDCEESWVPKNLCFWTVCWRRHLRLLSWAARSSNQSILKKVFFGRTDAKAEPPILWPPHVKSWLIGKAFDAGSDWGQEKKGATEDEMAGWNHWLDGHEFVWTQGVGDGQGGLACCDSWGCRESDTTEWLNWTALSSH